jgi:hypothetical protein
MKDKIKLTVVDLRSIGEDIRIQAMLYKDDVD